MMRVGFSLASIFVPYTLFHFKSILLGFGLLELDTEESTDKYLPIILGYS
jgi:hypothetical protein